MDALKPCPFCGSEATLMGGGLSQEMPTVWCVNGHQLNAGAEVWNTRADLDLWQPIETAPKDGTQIWIPDGENVITVFWHKGFDAFVSSFRRITFAPQYSLDADDKACGVDQFGRHYWDHSPEVRNPKFWTPKQKLPEATT